MKNIMDVNLMVENCLAFNTNGNNYAEFLYLLGREDFLSVKNWLVDIEKTGDKPAFIWLSKEDADSNGFISVNINGITIYCKHIGGLSSFCIPIPSFVFLSQALMKVSGITRR